MLVFVMLASKCCMNVVLVVVVRWRHSEETVTWLHDVRWQDAVDRRTLHK